MKKSFGLKYIFAVLAVSGAMAVAICLLAADAFALTAPKGETEITVPEVFDAKTVDGILKDSGLIKSRLWFRVYNKLRGNTLSPKGQSFIIPNDSGFDGIVRIINSGGSGEHTQIRVTIPEGSTVEDIASIVCDRYGICSREELFDAERNGDFSEYSFVSAVTGAMKERIHPLEGYLYPDTYCFFSDSTGYEVLCRMLDNFASKIDERYLKACAARGMTLDEAVTLGSVIMKEGGSVSDYGRISSVFHNRLKSSAFAGRLQSDATLVYVLGRKMEPSDKQLISPYNSYKNAGLPPSPICCPDLNAISYAIYPDETQYYYFVTASDGRALFAVDYYTHQQNVKRNSNE